MIRVLAILALLGSPAWAAPHPVESSDPWVTPSFGRPNSAGFITLRSHTADTLLGASSDCCAAVELHTHRMENDIARMRRVENIPLPAGETVKLAPKGLHLMLIGLKQPLDDGDRVRLILHFRHAADKAIDFPVSRARLLQGIESPKH